MIDLDEKEQELTNKLNELEDYVVKQYILLREQEGKDVSYNAIQSLKGTIGCNNNVFADCVNNTFDTFDDFYAQWLIGLCNKYGNKYHYGLNHRIRNINLELMKDEKCKLYIQIFLERNFYRNLNERMRYKPPKELWNIWFGDNSLCYELLLYPTYRFGKWENDVSEIRRADYNYWTIDHVLKMGLIQCENNKKYTFLGLKDIFEFYNNFIEHSKSKYEKEIIKKYLDYLKKVNRTDIPFLIPEFRFSSEYYHKYRIDFVILNSFSQEMIGFELSPSSSHMKIDNISSKTSKMINSELNNKWNKEIDKRNTFRDAYKIDIITFSDKDLVNIDKCFDVIAQNLKTFNNESNNIAREKAEAILAKTLM